MKLGTSGEFSPSRNTFSGTIFDLKDVGSGLKAKIPLETQLRAEMEPTWLVPMNQVSPLGKMSTTTVATARIGMWFAISERQLQTSFADANQRRHHRLKDVIITSLINLTLTNYNPKGALLRT